MIKSRPISAECIKGSTNKRVRAAALWLRPSQRGRHPNGEKGFTAAFRPIWLRWMWLRLMDGSWPVRKRISVPPSLLSEVSHDP